MPDVISAVPPTMPEVLPPGTVVDRYVLDSMLRDGGMATIYLGHHRTTQARVAVKILHTEYVHQPDFVARFEREAHVMGRLSGCPQIVSVHDAGALPDGRHYLVMDLIRGHDLRDELDQLTAREETMDVGRAVSLMRDVAAALAVAHRMDVVHRDIKPSNIMLESSAGREVAKLLDFGISADLAETGRKQDLTQGGTLIGTTRYMSPEQAAGISNVPTVDVWGMGVVLLEMLTGQPPPKKGWGLAGASFEGLPPIPGPLQRLLGDMLEPDSTRRVQTAREVESRLIEILPSVGIDVSLVSAPIVPRTPAVPNAARGGTEVVKPFHPMPPVARQKKSGTRPLLWGLAVGVIAAAATTGWWLVRTMASTETTPAAVAEAGPAPSPTRADEPPTPEAPEPPPEPEAAPSPEPEATPEPEPEPEPEPAEAATPKPRASKPRTSKPKASDTKVTPDGPAPAKKASGCGALVQETRDAVILGQWKTVLANTKSTKCWADDKTERERLRVRALHKLGRYAQCEREGQESGDPTVWSTVELCRNAAAK